MTETPLFDAMDHPARTRVLVTLIRKCLSDDLLSPAWRKIRGTMDSPAPSTGHCYVAAEALYHLSGSVTPHVGRDTHGHTHWWVRDLDGTIFDPTADQYTTRNELPPYDVGHRATFLTRKPSRRAVVLITRVRELLG